MGHRSLMDTGRMHGRAGGSWEGAQVPCAPQEPHRRIELNENSCYLMLRDPWFEKRESFCGPQVERKDLADLIHSCTTDRCVFIKRLRQMAQYPHRLLLITSALSQIKSPCSHAGVNPNRITQSLLRPIPNRQ